jgi:hypothetical protein
MKKSRQALFVKDGAKKKKMPESLWIPAFS